MRSMFSKRSVIQASLGIVVLLTGGLIWAQVGLSGAPSLLETVMQEQLELDRDAGNLIGLPISNQAADSWQSQHAVQLATLHQNAEALGAQSEMQMLPLISDVYVPDDASPAMEDFLVARAALANGFAQIHNQQVQNYNGLSTTGVNQGDVQIASVIQIQSNERDQFQQQYASQIRAQSIRAQALNDVAAPWPVPLPLSVPTSASPALRDFMTLRDSLLRGQIDVYNHNLTSDPQIRNSLMDQWIKQNKVSYDQLRQLAQNLSN